MLDEAPGLDASAMVARHLKERDLPRTEALFRVAPMAAHGLYLDTVKLGRKSRLGVSTARELFDEIPAKNTEGLRGLTPGPECQVVNMCQHGQQVSKTRVQNHLKG